MKIASVPGQPAAPREQRADLAIAATVFTGTLVSAWLTAMSRGMDATASLGPTAIYAAVLAVSLAVRRRWPAAVAVVVAVAYFAAITAGLPEIYAGNIAVFMAFYTVGAYSPNRRRAHAVRVLIIAGMTVWFVVVIVLAGGGPAEPGTATVAYTILLLLLNILYFAGGYYFGERTHAQLLQRQALEERTAELERAREHSAAQAVALDRVRIARELHDVVAHHVSLMGVQAGAARSVMERDPEKSRAILSGIEQSARTSLKELRQLLQTLRTSDANGDGNVSTDTAPTTHDLSSLPALVAETTAAGVPTTFVVIGESEVQPPPVVQVNLFRIAQEALTNARRHAGPNATADVRLRYDDDVIELEVANSGRNVSAEPGLGQRGMRERAMVSGGAIEMGPRARGGYLVRVRVPLTTEETIHA